MCSDASTSPVRPQRQEAGLQAPGRSRDPCACACVHSLIPPTHQVLKSHGQDYLVGNRLSKADIRLVELIYAVEEIDPSLLANFPLLKVTSATALGGQACISRLGV